jgi:hypothetical protein
MNDGIFYKMQCKNGHASNFVLQAEKFELLFEMGTMALLAGYTREAVSSFASSLERFYEYAIELILTHRGIESDRFEATWKLMSAQSERQLGAFYLTFLMNFGEAPEPFSMVEFRNKVIHKGYIPSTQEVEAYGENILNHIVKILLKLDIHQYMDAILKMTHKSRTKLNIDYSQGIVGIIAIPLALQHRYPHLLEELNFSDVLNQRREFQVMQGHFVQKPTM